MVVLGFAIVEMNNKKLYKYSSSIPEQNLCYSVSLLYTVILQFLDTSFHTDILELHDAELSTNDWLAEKDVGRLQAA